MIRASPRSSGIVLLQRSSDECQTTAPASRSFNRSAASATKRLTSAFARHTAASAPLDGRSSIAAGGRFRHSRVVSGRQHRSISSSVRDGALRIAGFSTVLCHSHTTCTGASVMNLPALPDLRAAENPSGPAIADDHTDLNNSQFLAAVQRAAASLRGQGVSAGDVVAHHAAQHRQFRGGAVRGVAHRRRSDPDQSVPHPGRGELSGRRRRSRGADRSRPPEFRRGCTGCDDRRARPRGADARAS